MGQTLMEIGSNTILVLVQDHRGYYEWVDQEELEANSEWYDKQIKQLQNQKQRNNTVTEYENLVLKHVVVTPQQIESLKKIYERNQDQHENFEKLLDHVYPTFGCNDAVTINIGDIWLCIETDGYTHS